MQDTEELRRKIELLEKENVQLRIRRLELHKFLLELSDKIEQFIHSPIFRDILISKWLNK